MELNGKVAECCNAHSNTHQHCSTQDESVFISEDQMHNVMVQIYAELANPISLADVFVSWLLTIYDQFADKKLSFGSLSNSFCQ